MFLRCPQCAQLDQAFLHVGNQIVSINYSDSRLICDAAPTDRDTGQTAFRIVHFASPNMFEIHTFASVVKLKTELAQIQKPTRYAV